MVTLSGCQGATLGLASPDRGADVPGRDTPERRAESAYTQLELFLCLYSLEQGAPVTRKGDGKSPKTIVARGFFEHKGPMCSRRKLEAPWR